MEDSVQQIKDAQYWAQQTLAEAVAKRLPIALAVLAIENYFNENGLPQPEDALAFATGGKINSSMVEDWGCYHGGN